MFGEYAIYREGKVVALVCDNRLFVKATVAGREVARSLAESRLIRERSRICWLGKSLRIASGSRTSSG